MSKYNNNIIFWQLHVASKKTIHVQALSFFKSGANGLEKAPLFLNQALHFFKIRSEETWQKIKKNYYNL